MPCLNTSISNQRIIYSLEVVFTEQKHPNARYLYQSSEIHTMLSSLHRITLFVTETCYVQVNAIKILKVKIVDIERAIVETTQKFLSNLVLYLRQWKLNLGQQAWTMLLIYIALVHNIVAKETSLTFPLSYCRVLIKKKILPLCINRMIKLCWQQVLFNRMQDTLGYLNCLIRTIRFI